MREYDIAVVGAGIAGVATAYYLAEKHGLGKVVLIDKLPPLSLTTSKSGENYRAYWPQPCMTAFASRSLVLMQDLIARYGDVFALRDFGYEFISLDQGPGLFGMNADGLDSAQLSRLADPDSIRAGHPQLSPAVRQVVRLHQAGALDVYGLGSLLLRLARERGVELCCGEVIGIDRDARGLELSVDTQADRLGISASRLVLAPGPFIGALAGMLGIELPVQTIVQRKFVIPDPDRVIPADMPFTIVADSQYLDWEDEERALLQENPDLRWLLEALPAGLHIKPEGRGHIKMGWAFNQQSEEPAWSAADDYNFPGVVLRGAAPYLPGLRPYVEKLPTPLVQFAGYYTRTAENWPLIGPLPEPGVYCVAALSGFGTMTGCAAGELCADTMAGVELPAYARHFHPDRYTDPEIVTEISNTRTDGQL